ncbi:MAG: biotin--[acetyl-CoA-carboxylase] ligase [Rickettsiaceae bacterium]|nr:biotin--[acetyl-CoA-carboxylase] ligase [Rickettsiaceae bacterium]
MKNTNEKLVEICNILNDLNFHDGTSIGAKLNISRTAVWKWVSKLQSYGIEITKVKGKGYLLKEPLILLDSKKIETLLKSEHFIIDTVESIDSTNNYLNNHNKSAIPHICIAEHQTSGRGRFSREWYSPFGKNIYFSMQYSIKQDISQLGGLSLAVGTIVCKAIEKACKLPNRLMLKWPNDITYNGKKLAGVLIEIRAEVNGNCSVIIGIGINVNMPITNKVTFNQEWASIMQITGSPQDRNNICAILIDKLTIGIEQYLITGFKSYMPEWKKRDSLFGKMIQIQDGNEIFKGIATGVDLQGHLLINLETNIKKAFAAGEATLLKGNV